MMDEANIHIVDEDEQGNARVRKALSEDLNQFKAEAQEQAAWECQPIKQRTLNSLKLYADRRVPTGDFLYAVLTNNLREACRTADFENLKTLWHIVAWCYNELPATAWGSPEKVMAWLKGIEE